MGWDQVRDGFRQETGELGLPRVLCFCDRGLGYRAVILL